MCIEGRGPFIPFYPCRRCSVPMGNSNSARRNQSRSVPTSPEVRLRFRLKSPYYIIITMDNSRRFDMRYFLYTRMYTLFQMKLMLIYIFYCYRLPGPTLHSGSITSIPTPFAQRFHQLQNTPAINSEYIYTYIPAVLNVYLSGTWQLLFNFIVIYLVPSITNYHTSQVHNIYTYNVDYTYESTLNIKFINIIL